VSLATTTITCSADTPGNELTTEAIFKKSLETYAALTSYSDQGDVVSVIKGKTYTRPFRIKLAKPDLYRIEFQNYAAPPSKMGAFWCAGRGNFSDEGAGVISADEEAQKTPNSFGKDDQERFGREINIPQDVATITRLFFNDDPGLTPLAHSDSYTKHEADEKVGGVDCYVFSKQKFGTRTVWIGKKDFLIHQIRFVASAEDEMAILTKVYKDQLSLPPPKGVPMGSNDDTETHTNIILNQNLTPADFK